MKKTTKKPAKAESTKKIGSMKTKKAAPKALKKAAIKLKPKAKAKQASPPAKSQVKTKVALTKAVAVKKVKVEKVIKKVEVKSNKSLSKEDKKAQVLAQIAESQKEAKPEVVLTNADGKLYCKAHDCDQAQTTDGYCRLHYIALWKRNRSKVKILEGGKLDKYIEDLTSKYPDKYLEMLRKDLSSEKDFNLIISEMDMEDSGDDNDSEEDASRFIEEVRGGVPSTADDDDGGF
jgi:hypothetical protein